MKPVCHLITIVAGGTAQRLDTDKAASVNALFFQPWSGNSSSTIAVGTSDLDQSTGVGCMALLLTTDSTFATPQTQNGLNQLHPYDYFVSGSNTGDKILVTYWIA